MNVRRVASIGSALVVAGIAALASYAHMRGLAVRYGQPEVIADLLPVSVDGMMVVATIALGDGRRYRWSAWLAFWIGVVASVVANVLAAQPSAVARCISAWPAVAFLLVVEVITRGGRLRHLAEVPAAVPAALEVDDAPADPWEYAEPIGDQAASDTATLADAAPASEPAAEAGTEPANPPATVADSEPATAPAKKPPRKRTPAAKKAASKPANTTAAKVAKWAAKMPDATHAEIAAKAGVSVRSVERYRPASKPATPPANEADSKPVNGTAVDLVTAP